MNGYLIIDGNSIAHAANNGTVLTVGAHQTQAIYGFLRSMRALMATHPGYSVVVAWDGISWRKSIFAEYKANRDREETIAEKRMKIAKDHLVKQKPFIEKALQFLGIPQIRASNMEADDLIAIFIDKVMFDKVKNSSKPIVIVSGDRDLIQLVGNRITWLDPIHDRRVNVRNFTEFTGVETPAQFIEKKALMGDTGDNIQGVGGIGDKGAVEFLKEYESFANFSNMALDGSLDVSKLPKKFRELAENEDKRITFSNNIRLMDLRTTARPAPIGLHVDKGEPSQENFSILCQKLMFCSFLNDLENWISVFPHFAQKDSAYAA